MNKESKSETPVDAKEINQETLAVEVLTVEEVANLLRVSEKTVYAAIKHGEIPGVRRIGSAIRISRAAVMRWLAEGERTMRRGKR
jgi:excisionase family DNA binding protein